MENAVSPFKIHRRTLGLAPLVLAILTPCVALWAQGPRISYYYNPLTNLGWAKCHIFQMGGSRQTVPFLPVVNDAFYHAPLGTDNYQKDVAVEGPIVFVGNGIIKAGAWDSYAGQDALGNPSRFSPKGPPFRDVRLGVISPLSKLFRDIGDTEISCVGIRLFLRGLFSEITIPSYSIRIIGEGAGPRARASSWCTRAGRPTSRWPCTKLLTSSWT